MSCSGLHCAGCAGGSAAPVVALAAFLGADWIVTHIVEVLATSAVCGALAVAVAVALLRWTGRREARFAARRAFLAARPVYQLAAEVRPHLESPQIPAIEPAREIHYHLHGLTPGQLAAIVRASTRPQDDQ